MQMGHAPTRTLQTFALVRIEAATAQIQATSVEIQTTTVQIRSAVVDGYVRAHGHASTLRVSDQNTLAFLGSAPVILSTLPPHVRLSERLVYRSYITLQVGKIEGLFKALASRGSYHIEEPDSSHLKPFWTVVYLTPSTDEEIADVQSDVFALMMKIQESLKSGHQLSIQRGAQSMSDLSVCLSNLGMYQAALAIDQFAVDLYRTLSKTNEDVYGPRLAHALSRVSYNYIDTGGVIEAYKVITEAVALARRLADANPTFEAQMELARLVSYSAFVGRCNGDWANSLKDAEESVQSYQRLIGNSELMMQAEVVIVEGLRMTLEGTHLYNFADALIGLHYNLSMTTTHDESVKAGVEALRIYRGLEERQSNGAFSAIIARLCLSLASNQFREIVPVDQALLYARQSVQHYEKVHENTGVVPHTLPFALGLEVKVLSRLERFDEAYGVCQKLARMIQIQMDDQVLRARSFRQLINNLFDSKRYAEAAFIVESWSSMYRSLFSNQDILEAYEYTFSAFSHIDDHSKSIQVAEASVSHWRMLTLQTQKYLQHIARSVLTLTHAYFRAKDYARAFKEGGEALKLFNSLISEDVTLLEEYMDALKLNIYIAKNAKIELESLERSRLVVQYSRALVNQFPEQHLFLICCIWDYATLLENFDHLADASVAISEALDWFDDHPVQDEESAKLHTDCLIDSAKFLRLQGHPDRALSLLEKTSTLGQLLLDADSVAWNILWGKAYNLSALYYMGQISIACSEIDVCLEFASQHNLEKSAAYTFCLKTVSHLYRCAGRFDDALVTIRRSIALDGDICETPSSRLLSDLLADTGQEAEALTVAHEAMQETKKFKTFSYTFEKQLHIQAQYSLALRLFASGELTQSQELLTQVRSFYQEHSKARNIWFIDLAITLWAMGRLECTLGRHGEGIGATIELNELRKRLRLVFPSLANLVELGLKRERNFTAWKNILKKYKLSCGHQDEDEMSDVRG